MYSKSGFNLVRHELNKLSAMPPWGRKQADTWDKLSNFVYRVKTIKGVTRQARAVARAKELDVELFENYTIRRWYNHHTHDQILRMFYAHPDVRPEEDRKHRTIDFYLRNIPFDLKISRFPKAYPENIKYAWQHRHHLAQWMYRNQSTQGRYHTGNRLFIILHHRTDAALTWQLRRDFDSLEKLIGEFLQAPILLGLTMPHQHTREVAQPWSAVIFHVE